MSHPPAHRRGARFPDPYAVDLGFASEPLRVSDRNWQGARTVVRDEMGDERGQHVVMVVADPQVAPKREEQPRGGPALSL
jgi:hypothetical protein